MEKKKEKWSLIRSLFGSKENPLKKIKSKSESKKEIPEDGIKAESHEEMIKRIGKEATKDSKAYLKYLEEKKKKK
jgi:hypothetical protein